MRKKISPSIKPILIPISPEKFMFFLFFSQIDIIFPIITNTNGRLIKLFDKTELCIVISDISGVMIKKPVMIVANKYRNNLTCWNFNTLPPLILVGLLIKDGFIVCHI